MGDAVLLDDSAAGTIVPLHTGQKLILKLPENSSTGYRWKVVAGIGRSLAQTDRSYQSDTPPARPGEPAIAGAPGTAVFTFVAKHHGKTGLKLALLPPGGHRKPAKFFALSINVAHP
jgi:predicted secreted protein